MGGKRPWGHQVLFHSHFPPSLLTTEEKVVWLGVTAGATFGWTLLFRHVMPWGHRDVLVVVRAYNVYDDHYALYTVCIVVLHAYYMISVVALEWWHLPWASNHDDEVNRPGFWWTLTHVMILPMASAAIALDSALHLRPPALNQMVSVWLRYQLWLVKDAGISLCIAIARDRAPLVVGHDATDRISLTRQWTFISLALQLARLHSLYQLGHWLVDCVPVVAQVLPSIPSVAALSRLPWYRVLPTEFLRSFCEYSMMMNWNLTDLNCSQWVTGR